MAQINASEIDVKTAFQVGTNGAILMRGFANPYATDSGLDNEEFSLASLTSLYFDVINGNLWIKRYNTNLDINDWANLSSGFLLSSYDTGWQANLLNGGSSADWTNVHLGSDNTTSSNVNHSLGAPLSDLLVKIYVITSASDSGSVQIPISVGSNTNNEGITMYPVDDDNFTIQTGSNGIIYLDNATGNGLNVTSSMTHYRILVYRLR